MGEVLTTLCESILNNTEILEELKGFDLIIHNTFAFCGALLGERFDIPRVEIMPAAPNVPTGLNHMIPEPVSYIPQLFTGFTNKMTFVERAVNLGVYLGMKLFMSIAFNRPMDALKVKHNIRPDKSFQETVADAELVIITADFALEYAQSLLPGRKCGMVAGRVDSLVPILHPAEFVLGGPEFNSSAAQCHLRISTFPSHPKTISKVLKCPH